MALTQTDLDRLDAAIAKSELEVEFADGQRVRYRSIDELLKARAHVASIVTASAGSSQAGASFRYNFRTSRGD
jgi:hypothetical protein